MIIACQTYLSRSLSMNRSHCYQFKNTKVLLGQQVGEYCKTRTISQICGDICEITFPFIEAVTGRRSHIKKLFHLYDLVCTKNSDRSMQAKLWFSSDCLLNSTLCNSRCCMKTKMKIKLTLRPFQLRESTICCVGMAVQLGFFILPARILPTFDPEQVRSLSVFMYCLAESQQ